MRDSIRQAGRVACVVAVLPISAPLLVAQSTRTEVRFLAIGQLTARDAALDATSVSPSSGTLGGGEIALRTPGFGLAVRATGGTLTAGSAATSDGELASAVASVQLGPRILAAEGGYGLRAVNGVLGTSVYSYIRAGGVSIIDLGGSGVSARLSAAVYLGGGGVPGAKVSGHEVSSTLEVRVGRTPIVLTGGYRAEVFVVTTGAVERPENVSGLVVGGGLRFGR